MLLSLRRPLSPLSILAATILLLVTLTLLGGLHPTTRPYVVPSWLGGGPVPSSLLQPDLAPLTERLDAWLARPAETHEAFIAASHEQCPPHLADKLVNPDQLNGEGVFWRERVHPDEIRLRRQELVNWVLEHIKEGAMVIQPQGKTKRGIVLTGGNQDTTLRLITVLRHLKRVGNKLPIEVFHYEDELKDTKQRREIEALGAKIVLARGVGKMSGVWKNWQIKGVAMIQSSFTELVYLDSDNIPLRPVDYLFEAPRYISGGRAAFWPDLSKDHPDNAIWRIIGEPCNLDQFTFESGQIVIDKAGNDGLNLAALWLAAGMQAQRDFWFHMCGGDKDTFRWGFRILGIDYTPAPRWMSALGFLDEKDNGNFCGHTTLQYDLTTPTPAPLFVHSNLLKHLGGGLERGHVFTHVMRMKEDAYDERSLDYAHMWVHFGNRGMCLKLDMHSTAQEDLTDAEREVQKPLLIPVGELEGKPFDGFEDAFFEEGGRVGGW